MSRQAAHISDLGRTIRVERQRAELTQSELARKAGIAPNHLSRLESGEKIDPRFATMIRLAKVLGVSLDTFANGIARRISSRKSTDANAAQIRTDLDDAKLAISAVDRQLRRLLKSLARVARKS